MIDWLLAAAAAAGKLTSLPTNVLDTTPVVLEGSAFLGIPGLTPGGIGIFAILGTIITACIKVWPILKKMHLDSDGSLRVDLMKLLSEERAASNTRFAELRLEQKDERKACDAQLDTLRAEINAQRAEVGGLRLQIVQLQRSAASVLPPNSESLGINGALERLRETGE